jgi:hypothetical protein
MEGSMGLCLDEWKQGRDGKPSDGGIATDYTNQVKIDSAGHIQIFCNGCFQQGCAEILIYKALCF